MASLIVGNVIQLGVRRNQNQRHARPKTERRFVGPKVNDRRLDMVIIALGIVPGDDDRALPPIRTVGDRVDGGGHHGFADLRVGIGRMVVVAQEVLLDRCVGIGGGNPQGVGIAALHVEHAAGFRQAGILNGREEIAQSMQFRPDRGSVRHIAEILRTVVVGDVGCVRSVRGHRPGRIGFLLVESLLIPAEGDCRLRQLAEECDVIGYVHQVRGGGRVGRGNRARGAEQHGKRKCCKRQIRSYGVSRIIAGIHRERRG